jgi:hypothetical protein
LFERRFEVFDAFAKFLSQVTTNGMPSDEQGREFLVATRAAKFVFDNEIFSYRWEVYERATRLKAARIALPDHEVANPNIRTSVKQTWASENEWFQSEMENFENRFARTLTLRH